MKTLKKFRWVVPVLILICLGYYLADYSQEKVGEDSYAYELHSAAETALKNEEYEKAYELYLYSSFEFSDPHLRGKATTEAANLGWAAGIADYETLVSLYKEALRYDPGQEEASFNLELLYWLKDNAPGNLPEPEAPGTEPGEETVPSGDI